MRVTHVERADNYVINFLQAMASYALETSGPCHHDDSCIPILRLRRILEADILLYEFALDLFKNQTSEALGTVWEPAATPVMVG